MVDFFLRLLDTSGFVPRWGCGEWTKEHGWLHILSDLGTWSAYTAIPIVLAYFVLRRRDIVFPRIFWLFSCFILFCGLVHLVEASIFWWPLYRLSGLLKLSTALVSWATVVALVRIMPQALTIPSMKAMNDRLQDEIVERSKVEQRFRLVVEASPSALVMIDRQGEIVLVNSQTEDMFGYSREELIGKPVELLVPVRLRERHPQYREDFFAHAVARPMGKGLNLYGLRKDGAEFPVEIGLNPITTQEGLMVLSAIVDITQRKQGETAIQEVNEHLQRKNEEMEQFVYTISHDLKSPLVTIMGFIGLLREDAAENRMHELQDAANRIEGAADHMSELIDDLLQLSRVGRVTDTLTEVDVVELIRSIGERLSDRIRQAGAVLEIQDDMPSVLADHTRLSELFENLLTNAVKYGCGSSDAKITVGSKNVDGTLRFFVRDNGQGIPEEYHQKIFGMFQRLESNQEGTGVGLAIVSRIAQAHNAHVWVESQPGAGTTFWIQWPSIST